jgi:hypothetical protein
MSVVNGKDVVITIADKLIACGRSLSLTTSTSFIETTTVGDGKGATFKPQKNTTTGSIEGVTYLNEPGKLTLPELRKLQLAHTLLSGAYTRTSETGDMYIDQIEFYIATVTDTGNVGDFATAQIDIQVNGDPVIVLSCEGLVAPMNVVITNEGLIPVTYRATWTYDAAYSIGLLSYSYSTDGGETYLPVPGGATISPTRVDYTLESETHLPHTLKITITCPDFAEAFYTATGEIS